MLTAELHCHSALSHDGRDPVELLLEQAREVGLDALAVTDHDEITASLEARDLAPEYDLLGIPGVEVSSAAGHVLAIGVTELIPAGLTFQETLDRIRAAGGAAIVPHPFQRTRSGVAHKVSRAALADVDAVEVYNSRLLTGRANRRARRFAEELGLPMTAGSDAHIAEMVGQAPTTLEVEDSTAAGVVGAIRAGRTHFRGRRTPWHISFRQAAGGVRRRIRHRFSQYM